MSWWPLEDVAAPRPLEAKITLTVGEPGGRSLDRTVTLPIRPSHAVIGVKKLFNDEQLVENSVSEIRARGGRCARARARRDKDVVLDAERGA